jgi:cephalosporin-C deacetylase
MSAFTLITAAAQTVGFDPTYGYDLAALQAIAAPPPPPGFVEFWTGTFAQTAATPVNASMHEIPGGSATHRTFEVDYTSLGGFRVGAWLTIPRDGIIERGLVIGHGYGGREQPDPQPPAPHAAAIYPCARGMNRSARPDLPNTAPWHVIHGIKAKETYIHRFCVADLWAAATALTAMVPQTAGWLEYIGESFGGGMGALALPWDRRFRRATLMVPSFGNHPLRLTMPCVGSGQAVRIYHQHHPEVPNILSYFDAATAAGHIKIPVLCACAQLDPAVPPPGQFAIYNALPGAKRLHVLQAGHYAWPGEAEDRARRDAAIAAWLAQPLCSRERAG